MITSTSIASSLQLCVLTLVVAGAAGAAIGDQSSVMTLKVDRMVVFPYYWVHGTSHLVKRTPLLDQQAKDAVVNIAMDLTDARIIVDYNLTAWLTDGRKKCDLLTLSLFTPRTKQDNSSHEIKWSMPLGVNRSTGREIKDRILPVILADGALDPGAEVIEAYMNQGWTNVQKTMFRLDMTLEMPLRLGSGERSIGDKTWGIRIMVHVRDSGDGTDEWKCASTDPTDELCLLHAGSESRWLTSVSVWIMVGFVALIVPLVAVSYWLVHHPPQVDAAHLIPFIVFFSKGEKL